LINIERKEKWIEFRLNGGRVAQTML
jgi:hypothetical protein